MSNSCDPVDWSTPGSSVHGIFQARILEWIAISFSRGSSRPRNQTQVSCIAGRCDLWGPPKFQTGLIECGHVGSTPWWMTESHINTKPLWEETTSTQVSKNTQKSNSKEKEQLIGKFRTQTPHHDRELAKRHWWNRCEIIWHRICVRSSNIKAGGRKSKYEKQPHRTFSKN